MLSFTHTHTYTHTPPLPTTWSFISPLFYPHPLLPVCLLQSSASTKNTAHLMVALRNAGRWHSFMDILTITLHMRQNLYLHSFSSALSSNGSRSALPEAWRKPNRPQMSQWLPSIAEHPTKDLRNIQVSLLPRYPCIILFVYIFDCINSAGHVCFPLYS